MDYQKLCLELFGTDDVKELKRIAKKIRNNRNAGRKHLFDDKELKEIKKKLSDGETINEIAKEYNTSRQIISKYINGKPEEGYTMRMTYMLANSPCTVIDVDFLNERVKIENRTDDILHRAFGCIDNPDWKQFLDFLGDRCFPKTRFDLKNLLRQLGIDSYDVFQIVEKTKGKTCDDNMWIKIKYFSKGERLNAAH